MTPPMYELRREFGSQPTCSESPKTVTPTPHSLHVTARSTHMHGAAHRNRHDRRSGTDRRHDHRMTTGAVTARHPVQPPRTSLSATSLQLQTSLRPRHGSASAQWSPSRSGLPPCKERHSPLCVGCQLPCHFLATASTTTSFTEESAGEGFLPSRRRCPGLTRPPRASVCRTRKSSATSSYMG